MSIIAPVWRKLFSPRFFQVKTAKFLRVVDKKLDVVLQTVPRPFAGDARELATMTRGMTGHVVKAAAENARELANSNQKRISEALVERVREELKGVYKETLAMKGPGSLHLQKTQLPTYVENHAKGHFNNASKVILQSLDDIAEETGEHFKTEMRLLCQKVELSMSKLWETSEARDRLRREQPQIIGRALIELQYVESQILRLRKQCTAPLDGDA